MLISGKLHSRVKSRNSRASVETLDFAQVCTFFRRDRSWIASGGTKGGGAIAGWYPMLFPADAGTPSIDPTWQAVARPKRHKTARGGGGGRAWESLSPPLSDAAGQLVDVAGGWVRKTVGSSRVSGTMAHLSKRRHGAQQGTRSPTGRQAPGWMQHDNRPKSQCSFLFPIEAD